MDINIVLVIIQILEIVIIPIFLLIINNKNEIQLTLFPSKGVL